MLAMFPTAVYENRLKILIKSWEVALHNFLWIYHQKLYYYSITELNYEHTMTDVLSCSVFNIISCFIWCNIGIIMFLIHNSTRCDHCPQLTTKVLIPCWLQMCWCLHFAQLTKKRSLHGVCPLLQSVLQGIPTASYFAFVVQLPFSGTLLFLWKADTCSALQTFYVF